MTHTQRTPALVGAEAREIVSAGSFDSPENSKSTPAKQFQRIGVWTVLGLGDRRTFCQCQCGSRRWIAADALATTTSCGCRVPSEREQEARRREIAGQLRPLDWRAQR
jgi:hypothetical protein